MKNEMLGSLGRNNNKVILNLIQNLQRKLLSLRNGVRGRSRIKYGMTPNLQGEGPVQQPYGAPLRSGFTLIELLVVVLIIGILAAVALPQYQKAVEKARAAQALTMIKSVFQAGKAYHIATGNWPSSFDELAVDVPWTGTTRVSSQACISDVRSNTDWSLQICNGNGNSPALYMSRLSGEYATNILFIMYFGNQPILPTDEIICVEKDIATKPIGYYCEKILKGTMKYDGNTHREYVLP